MAVVSFPSPSTHDVIEVEFLHASDQFVPLKLLVDSGFTGTSSLALSAGAHQLMRAPAPASKVVGALSGTKPRAVVTCRLPNVQFERSLIAILADTDSLSLPDDVAGIAGLRFLRCFRRWGAEQVGDAGWRFFLEF